MSVLHQGRAKMEQGDMMRRSAKAPTLYANTTIWAIILGYYFLEYFWAFQTA